MNTYKKWNLIKWDGNLELGYKCYRRVFKGGHVSVGVGEFTTIVHSFGANSHRSYSSTRWRESGTLSEVEAMDLVDKQYGD
jgi:hypothetical protein